MPPKRSPITDALMGKPPGPISKKTGKSVKPTKSYTYPWARPDGTPTQRRNPAKGRPRETPRFGGPMGA